MRIIKVEPEEFASNSYIITNDGQTAVIIDPSEPRISKICKEHGLECKYVILTHGHFDHVGGCGKLFNEGAEICCGEGEKDFVFSPANLSIFGGVYIPHFKIARAFTDGEKFSLCGIDFTALSTPGHTAGGMCYITENSMFTGDTLFCRSVGRTDLPMGNSKQLYDSVKKLFSLEGDYKIYCGHGEDSTLDSERKYNPFSHLKNN